MQLIKFFSAIFTLLVLIGQQASSTNIYVTPYASCLFFCQNDLAQPLDNLIWALMRAQYEESPVIILLASEFADHYLVTEEIDPLWGTGQVFRYDFSSFNFTTLEIKPLFCDEADGLTLPRQTKCINRDETVTVYFKTLTITVNVQSQLIVRNIDFNGIEASKDYSLGANLSQTQEKCRLSRTKCCDPAQNGFQCWPLNWADHNNNQNQVCSEYNVSDFSLGINCSFEAQPFFFVENYLEEYQAEQNVIFVNTNLQNFWGVGLISFIEIQSNSSFNLVFENSTIDDVLFERGLVYISSSDPNSYSRITFNNMNFSNYNKWLRYNTTFWTYHNNDRQPSNIAFREGYLLLIKTTSWFRGEVNIIDSHFWNMSSVSRHTCESFDDIGDPFLFFPRNGDRSPGTYVIRSGRYLSDYQTNLPYLMSDTMDNNFVSSLIYIPQMWGSVDIKNSSFKKISGIAGSVLRIDNLMQDLFYITFPILKNSSVTINNTVFDQNFAHSRFANILITSPYKPIGCPTIIIQDSQFLNTGGCPGSYGNIGLFCSFQGNPFDSPFDFIRDDPDSEEFDPQKDIALFFYPQITVNNSIFQNNLIGLSNSLAIIGAYTIALEQNIFQDNGGPSGDELMQYSLNRSQAKCDHFTGSYYFGQSSAVYINTFFNLRSNNNTFKGNWSPFQGSQALGISLTLLNWINYVESYISFYIQMKHDRFIDHTGVPSIISNTTQNALNCYMPPLITFANSFQSYDTVNHIPRMVLKGVIFENNLANYGTIVNRCDALSTMFTFPVLLIQLVQQNLRFRGGFFKFLTPSEAADKAYSVQDGLDTASGPYAELGLYFNQIEIRNNTVNGGCLFPTLRSRTLLLDDLQIESNQINPSVESQEDFVMRQQVNVDNVLNNKAGIFCGYQKAAVYEIRNITINADNLKVRNNVGPIFNLFSDESNNLFLMNSLFINNTCEYTSTIIALEGSSVQATNNIFINNTNAYGNVFITSSSSSFSSSFTTYQNNNGRHASLVYSDNKATTFEISSIIDSNTVNPNSYLYDDSITPQGGLYFLSLAVLNVQNSAFSQNNPYGGIIVSTGSAVSFDSAEFSNHSVVGASLLGNFLFSSNLTVTNVNMTSNVLVDNPVTELQPAFFTVIASRVKISNLKILNNTTSNKGTVFLGKMAKGDLTNVTLSNFMAETEKGLISLSFSTISITNLKTDQTTPLFDLYQAKLTLTSTSIQELQPSFGSLYMINTVSSNLTIYNLKYIGSLEEQEEYSSLITGFSNRAIISDAYFLDTMYGTNNKVFDLRESSLVFITKSAFEYTNSSKQPIIFSLESSQTVVIEKCTFSQTAQLVQDQNTQNNFYFTDNTIVTDSNNQKISMTGNNVVHILNNNILRPMNDSFGIFPVAQIQIVDNTGTTNLNNNVFFSLHGSKGVVFIQSTQTSYDLESTGNIFFNSSGSYGGALHLDGSTSTTSPSPSAVINASVFLLNSAQKEGSGTGSGGAIYQTTSTLTKQDTNVTNSIFINNNAEMVGGAIFFDYMLPTVDRTSEFRNNSANLRPNHLGSYPVRLDYYRSDLADQAPALPWDTPSRLLSSSELTHWDNVPSGLTSSSSYTFVLLDMFGQVFDSDNSSMLEVIPVGLTQQEIYVFSNKLSIVAVNGTYIYDSFKFTYQTYGTINVTFKSTAIDENRRPPLGSHLDVNSSLLVEVRFRGCGLGEYVITEGNTTACSGCQAGFWQPSPLPDAASCQECDSLSMVCLGGGNIGIKQGYWRLNRTSDIVLECPVGDACLGTDEDSQDSNSQEKCAYGYKGNLCSNCIEGWAKSGDKICTDCSTNTWYYIRVFLVLMFQLALIAQAVGGTITATKQFNENQKIGLNAAILVRVLSNYFQLISLVSSYPVTWPDVIKNISSASTQVSSVSENVFTLDCLFKSDYINGTKIVFIKLVLSTVSPFVLVFLGFICTAIYFFIKKRPIIRNRDFTNKIVALTVIICFMMQPSAIQAAFSIFKCANLYREDSPVYFMAKDYDVQCWEGDHLYWALGFGLPALLVWAVFLPLFVFNALRNHKNRLQSAADNKYSFLSGGYTYDKYYWEIIVMLRKFLMISITIIASFQSTTLEIYASVLLILFWHLLHIFTHPYADERLNRLEEYSLLSAILVNFCGLYFKIISPTKGLDTIVIIAGLFGNLLFLVYFVILYYHFQIEMIKQNKRLLQIVVTIGSKLKRLNSPRIERITAQATILIDQLERKESNREMLPKVTIEEDIDIAKEAIETPYTGTTRRPMNESMHIVNVQEAEAQEDDNNGDEESSLSVQLREVDIASPKNGEEYDLASPKDNEDYDFVASPKNNEESDESSDISASLDKGLSFEGGSVRKKSMRMILRKGISLV